MKSCLRVSSTKDVIKITVNAGTEFEDLLEDFKIKLPRIRKYYEKERLPIHIVPAISIHWWTIVTTRILTTCIVLETWIIAVTTH